MILHVWTRLLLLAAIKHHMVVIISWCPTQVRMFADYEAAIEYAWNPPVPGAEVWDSSAMDGSEEIKRYVLATLPWFEDYVLATLPWFEDCIEFK